MKAIIYTEEQVIEKIGPLTTLRLRRFLEAECVVPHRSEDRDLYTAADLARLELLCELREDLDLDVDALSIVMSLIDQIHGLRRQMRMLLRAVETEPKEVQERIQQSLSEIV